MSVQPLAVVESAHRGARVWPRCALVVLGRDLALAQLSDLDTNVAKCFRDFASGQPLNDLQLDLRDRLCQL